MKINLTSWPKVMKLPLFNSPRAALCTCLPKYNLNTYLGRCAHGCIYCLPTFEKIILRINDHIAVYSIISLRKIADEGIATVARIDPIIPTINDDEGEFEELVLTLKKAGVKQVTVSTLKPVTGFFSALRNRDREVWDRLRKIYADGRWVMGYKYLHEEKRRKILERLRPIVLRHGLNFAHCREGFSGFNTSLCDGTAHCRPLLSSF